MAKVVVSYRRSDSAAIAGRIRDRLAQYYGADAIFMDIDSIPLGTDFRQQIQKEVTKNDILLALIGPRWIGAKKGGISRINDEMDPIRIEVETALNQDIPLIPVLVGGATMPKSTTLPDSLQKLCFLNAAEVDDGRDFHQHVDRLIRAMDRLLTESRLGGLAEKAENRTLREVDPPSPLRTETAASNEQLPDDRVIQDMPDSKKSAAFATFFCEQTLTTARLAMGLGIATFVLFGVVDFGRELQIPELNAYRGLIAVPSVVIIFAASYWPLAQRYWQTFLSVVCVFQGLVLFMAAWVSHRSETTSFDLERWLVNAMLLVAIGAILPLRLPIAAIMTVFGLGMIYLFLFWTNQSLVATLWLQLAFGLTLAVFCAAAYFREQLLWALFQSARRGKRG